MITIQSIKMKKIVFTAIVLIFTTSFCSAYMEDKVFCTISKDSITVTMEKSNNYKCSEYLSVLSQAINSDYNDILSVQKLINQWYDVDFWKQIREEKREKIKKMISIKDQIETAIAKFDSNLFEKIKEYVVYNSTPYRATYKKALNALNAIQQQWWKHSSSTTKKIEFMQEEITVIDNIIQATDYDTLIKNFNRHLYLKNQIEWK